MKSSQRSDFLIPLLTVLSDAIAIEASFLLSYWIRFYSPFADVFKVTLGYPPLDAYVYGSFVVIPIWLYLFSSRKLYRPRRAVSITDELFPIVRTVTLGMLIVMSAAFFYRAFSYSRIVFALLWVNSIILIAFGRFLLIEFEKRRYRKGLDLRRAVIVGNNETANRIYESFLRRHELGYRVDGYFADSKSPEGSPLSNAEYLGTLAKAPTYIRTEKIEHVFISLTYKEHPQLYELIESCEGLNVEFMMVPDLLELMTSRVRIQELAGFPFLKIKEIPLSMWDRITKRAFDIVVSVIVLLLTSPLFLLVAILIKLDSRGRVFYVQERIGLDGRSFMLLKFRTMKENAEAETGPVWAKRGDPRVTRVGKFLRRFSIDELPQLLNVLKGEMSIVGPRPERKPFVEQFRTAVPRYLDRHRVKAGMTGWAQVNGLRQDAPIEERTKYDIYYIENWSLAFDMKIIFRTVKTVLFGKDAY